MIDWNRVETLYNEIGSSDFCEVIELFLDETDGVIQRLETAPDPARYEADLHFLKGSALNLGLTAFSALCQAGELLAANGETAAVDIAAVVALYYTSTTAMAERIRQLCHRKTSAA